MAPSSQKNTKSVMKMWRGPLHAYHGGLRAVITEAAASGSLSGPSVRGPGGPRIFFRGTESSSDNGDATTDDDGEHEADGQEMLQKHGTGALPAGGGC